MLTAMTITNVLLTGVILPVVANMIQLFVETMTLVHLNLVTLKSAVLHPLFPAMIMMLVLLMDVIHHLDVLILLLLVTITTNVLLIPANLLVVVNTLPTFANIKMPVTLLLVILIGDANTKK
jgi:hypothetical protein